MKKTILICAPFSSRSGYGDHARDIFESIFIKDKYNLRTIDVPWGDCPRNSLDSENIVHKAIIDGFITAKFIAASSLFCNSNKNKASLTFNSLSIDLKIFSFSGTIL